MKPKKLVKKLSLNKRTIATFIDEELTEIKGGIGITQRYTNCVFCPSYTCNSCPTNNTIDPYGACCC